MATKRFGYLDDLSLKNQKVGIGTSTANEKLEVLGGTRGENVVVTGIATLTSYSGFQNKNTSYTDNIVIGGGESGTLSGEIVIGAGLTMSIGTGATSGQGSIKSLKVNNTFIPPCGGILDRPSAPETGSLFYNKDFKTIEYWDGSFWRQVEYTARSGRGIIGGGKDPSGTRQTFVGYVNIMSQGNENDFGDLTDDRSGPQACSDGTRCLFAGGNDGTPFSDIIDYNAIQSGGNFVDFGNLTTDQAWGAGGCSSSTRGLFSSWYPHSAIIDYVEIQTTGNALDFGDRSITVAGAPAALASPTRAVFAGGYTSGSPLPSVAQSYMDFVTISSKGNAVKFGDLTKKRGALGGCSNTVRGLFCGGTDWAGSTYELKVIDYITIASTGNAIHFGELTFGRGFGGATSTQTRGLIGGMRYAPAVNNVLDYISMQHGGSAIDFGDLIEETKEVGMTSDSHGGLGGF